MNQNLKLTTLSHGGGCGCKLSPTLLNELLAAFPPISNPQLLLGYNSSDDAALYHLNSEQVLVATTDFFMPIVDDPFDFGCIAAANALSDVYAMGGKPILALNLLGMPTDKVGVEGIEAILAGGNVTCVRADVAVAGGHSIDCKEPFYGLSVCGLIHPSHIKRNSTAQANDVLILSKPLGIGVLAAAYNQNKLDPADYPTLIAHATQLNDVGIELAKLEAVHAMTDVTGFGLLGHLLELCQASNLQACLDTNNIPLIEQAVSLASAGIAAGASARNWEYCQHNVVLSDEAEMIKTLLTDPQTNGGLLVACSPQAATEVQDILTQNDFERTSLIGQLDNQATGKIKVV